jgi:predicted lipid-binding transport protein (Tim44 family)
MSNTDPPVPSSEDPAESHPGPVVERIKHGVLGGIVPGYDKTAQKVLDDMEAEAASFNKMLDAEDSMLKNRPPAEATGVDISAINALDPSFDDQQFLEVARECFYNIREARTSDNPLLADLELSPELMTELRDVIQGDVTSHRHHLLPGLEIRTAVIRSVDVTAAKFTIVVRFHLESEEVDRDAKGEVVAGDFNEREWDEDWTFWRDPTVDSGSIDRQHTLTPGGWMCEHRGWVVTSIERLGPQDPLDPTNL